MWLLLTPLCLALISSSLTSASQPYYVITVPTTLAQGAEEKACVTFLDLKGTVEVKLELKKDDQIYILAEYKIDVHDDHSECYPFKVPVVKEVQTSTWLLHVTAHGDNIHLDKSDKVIIMKQDMCIIQTDKLIYKPGDIVRFRLISMDRHFHSTHTIHPFVELIDSNKNRIARWRNVSTNHGFADFSFHLAQELSLGEYEINAPPSCTQTFKVEEYVLKRFEVNINAPSKVTLMDRSFHLDVCGRYTYGKPVEGSIDLSICAKGSHGRRWRRPTTSSEEEAGDNCIIIKNAKTDSKGCVSKDIYLGLFNFSKSEHDQGLDIKLSLTEDQTGHTEKESANINLNRRKNIEFLDIQSYQKGLPYHSQVKVTDEKDQPMPNKAVYVYRIRRNHDELSSNSDKPPVTDENGIACFTLNTSSWDSVVMLRATLSPDKKDDEDHDDDDDDDDRYSEGRTLVLPFYSPSKSQLTIKRQSNKVECDSDQTLTVEYDIQKKTLDSDSDHLHFFYLLRNKVGILLHKERKIDIKDQSNNLTVHGSFPISIHIDASLFPGFTMIVFSVLPNGETIAKGTHYEVPLCIKDKVQLKFSEEQVLPGASVNLEVSANAGSLCSIRSVDKGYLLHKPHISSPKSELKEFAEFAYNIMRTISWLDPPERPQCPDTDDEVVMTPYGSDVHSLFKENGIKLFTNTQVKKPLECAKPELGARSAIKVKKPGDKEGKEIAEHFTRRHFPDSWLFELVPVGSDGHTVLNRATPHTITKWVTDAFCLSKTGFAVVSDVELTTFQPYFIDLILPYSVIQGEKFTIQAVVFSYVKNCILIVVSLPDSEDLATAKNKEQAKCVCEGHSHSFAWDVTAVKQKTLKIHVDSGFLEQEGKCTEDPVLISKDQRKDSIEKAIVVKSRGHEEEKAQTFLLYPAESREVHITLTLPERLVAGSERAHIIIMGDLMANVAVSMEHVVNLPDGCGEQNIAKFSRYVCLLDYLEGVQELTPEKKAKTIKSLVEAYQKQLTYRNDHGSYSSFADESNIWVTALVVKAFTSAKDWIYIDEKHIQQAVEWLQTVQGSDGCFRKEGYFIRDAGEVDDKETRTAYVVISLLEHPRAYNGSIVENALSCLRRSVDRVTSAFTQALLAYVFTLSGDSDLRDEILKKLDERATRKDGTKYWATGFSITASIETASYILLALLSDKTTTKHLEESADIVRWIVNQQNPHGGFQSSQDTTMALQALAKYARATKNMKGNSTVTIRSKSGFEKIVYVDKTESLLVHTVDLPEIPGEYTVSATGKGIVYLQSHIHYHTLPDKSERGHFSLKVSTKPADCTHESQRRFDVHMDVSYSGKRQDTNMVVILIEPLSGYIPDKNSLKLMKKHKAVKRTEVSAERVSIYMDKLTHTTARLIFSMEREANVENLQPATVAVYDYYDPEKHTVVEYNAPCSAGFQNTEGH